MSFLLVLIVIFAVMRVFAIFMTILMLITGFDLCKDEESYINSQKTALSTAEENTHEQESPCTPFCNCARCPFSVVVSTRTTGLLADITVGQKFHCVLPGTPIEMSASVWQPPKFS